MNPIVHFDIMAGPGTDKKALQDFYAKTFGWTIDAANPMGYGIAMPDGPSSDPSGAPGCGINGAVDNAEDHAKVVIYIGVDDPAAYLAKIKAAGDSVIHDVTVTPDMVTFATFRDPAGNEMGLVKNDTP